MRPQVTHVAGTTPNDGHAPRPGRTSRYASTVVVAVAVAAVAWTFLAPASLPRTERHPPSPPPARLDPGFVAAVATLTPLLPREEVVAVEPGDARRRIASWYWTMAAFTAPEARFTLAGRGADGVGWLLLPLDHETPAGWSRQACAEGWCLWRR